MIRENIKKAELLLIPLIAENTEDCKKWLTPGFVGAYYKDTNKPQWEEKIILVYETSKQNIRPILNWNSSKFRFETYQETIENKTYSIYSYIIPPEFKKDIYLMFEGKYSSVSTQAKNIILDFYFKANKGKCLAPYNLVNKILNPPLTETLTKDREYTEAFGEKQILNLNNVNL